MTKVETGWAPCWGDDHGALVVADVAAQDDRILLAVHQPPVMQRLPVPLPGRRHALASAAREATQEELLTHLVDDDPREGTLVVPIIGAPGTGKSHLIRWLRAAVPDRDDLVVRHVPREGTSLPDVVRILLEGLEGGRFDELRRGMDAARGNIVSLDQAATRLSLRIAELVQHGLGSGWRLAGTMDEELRSGLCHPNVLPALLTDAAARAHLTRPGGPIHRLASDIVEGYERPSSGDDEELGFRVDDLAFKSLRGLGPYAARAVVALRLPGKSEAAVQILSDALDVAAADVIGLGSGSLADVLFDLRAELLAQGKQLLIMFEDIAIARGLEQDLFDAIATPAIREGERRLCTLRVALAVTNEHWDQRVPETLATRVSAWGGQMFSLDAPGGEAAERAPELVGRYLNVARLGTAGVREMDPASLTRGVPNACDACPFDRRAECHAVFGKTAAGHGLFPLTPEAVKTLAVLADADARPRMILSDVVSPTVADRGGLADRRFPSPGGLRELVSTGVERGVIREIGIEQAEALERSGLGADERERAETLLRAWFGGGSTGAVLGALGLPEIAVAPRSSTPHVATRPARVPTPGPSPVDRSVADERVAVVEAWATGRTSLPPTIVRPLRRLLYDELRAGVRWDELGLSREAAFEALGIRGSDQTKLNLSVRIRNTAGGGATGTAEPLIDLEPSVANAMLLRGLLLRDQAGGFGFNGGADALCRLRVTIRAAEGRIARRLAQAPFNRAHTTDAAQVLLLAAAALVAETGADDPTALVQTLVPIDQAAEPSNRSSEWNALVAGSRLAHALALGLFTAAATRSQGGLGAPTILDPSLVDERRLSQDPGGLKKHPESADFEAVHADLVRKAASAVDAEATATEAIIRRIEAHIGEGASLALKTIRDAVDDAVSEARAAHVLRGSEILDALQTIRLPSSTAAAALVEDARRATRLARGPLTLDVLARLARLDVASLRAVCDYLDGSNRVLETSILAARELIQGAGGGAAAPATAAARGAISGLLARCEVMV